MADAAHPKSHRAQRFLGPLDRAQLFRRDFRMIGDARRQTRRRGLVPRAKACATGKLANLRLCQTYLVQRTADAKLARCLPAWPVIAAIVGIAAISHDRKPTFGRDAVSDV